jgi:hypothetical protein
MWGFESLLPCQFRNEELAAGERGLGWHPKISRVPWQKR